MVSDVIPRNERLHLCDTDRAPSGKLLRKVSKSTGTLCVNSSSVK